MKVRLLLGVAGALAAMPLLGSPAWSAACQMGSVGSYIALDGTGCNVGPVEFSNIQVSVTTSGGGSVTLGNFTPFISGNEFGLALNYTALAPVAGATADIAWTYNVSGVGGVLLNDALLALAGNTTGAGQAQVSEILSNGVTLSLNAPGSTSVTFAPVSSLFVLKDQIDFVGPAGGTSTTSILTNAFSPVPGPLAGAGLPGLIAACGGLLGLARRRRRQMA